MYTNTLRLTTLIIYSSKKLSICNFNHHLWSQNTSNFSSRFQQVITRRGGRFWNKLCNLTEKTNESVNPIALRKIKTVYRSGLTIVIGYLQENYAHRKIRESLLGRSGVGRCPGLSNRWKFGLDNQQAGKYISATELEIIRSRHFPLGELLWHLITQVNDSDLADYITVFDLRRDKRRLFIPFLVYALFYPSIASNLVTLDNLIPWSESVCTHTCYPFLKKTLLRWHRTVKTGLLMNW